MKKQLNLIYVQLGQARLNPPHWGPQTCDQSAVGGDRGWVMLENTKDI